MKGKLIAILLAVLILTGCVGRPVSFDLDGDGNYTGFETVEEGYTRRAAKLFGWVVLEDLTVTENVRVWQRFLKRAGAGKASGVRVAEFFGEEMALVDLFYQQGQYRAFFSDGFDMRDEPLPFLLTLSGETNGQAAYVVALSGDDSLTIEQVMHRFFSSQLEEPDIPAHRVLFLGIGEPNW